MFLHVTGTGCNVIMRDGSMLQPYERGTLYGRLNCVMPHGLLHIGTASFYSVDWDATSAVPITPPLPSSPPALRAPFAPCISTPLVHDSFFHWHITLFVHLLVQFILQTSVHCANIE